MPRGRNFFGPGFWWRGAYSPYLYGGMPYPVWGGGRGNPYPFCRFYPWLPRRWWAYGYPLTGGGRGFCTVPLGMGYPYMGYRPYPQFGLAGG